MSTTNDDHPITLIARHPGLCPCCGSYFDVGTPIARPNAFESWRHAVCPRTKFDFDPGDVCPECFTVRATTGACSC